MTVVMNDSASNDYTIFCNTCGSEEICEHEFRMGEDLDSQDFCEACCPKCIAIGTCNMCDRKTELMPDDFDTCNRCMFGEQEE